MRAGSLTNKITIEHYSESIDSFGDSIKTWSEFAPAWAEIITQSGKEFTTAREQHATLSAVIKIRYMAGVTTAMRVNDSGVFYNILAAFDPNKQRRELRIYCETQL